MRPALLLALLVGVLAGHLWHTPTPSTEAVPTGVLRALDGTQQLERAVPGDGRVRRLRAGAVTLWWSGRRPAVLLLPDGNLHELHTGGAHDVMFPEGRSIVAVAETASDARIAATRYEDVVRGGVPSPPAAFVLLEARSASRVGSQAR